MNSNYFPIFTFSILQILFITDPYSPIDIDTGPIPTLHCTVLNTMKNIAPDMISELLTNDRNDINRLVNIIPVTCDA